MSHIFTSWFSSKKKRSKTDPKLESESTAPPSIEDQAPPKDDPYAEEDDPYAEVPTAQVEGKGEGPAPDTKAESVEAEAEAAPKPHAAKTEKKRHRKGGEVVSAAEVENPQALIAEAIGGQAMTLAKTNTVLKGATLSLSAIALILGMAAWSGWNQETEYRYFFVSNDGTVLEREPLSAPVLSLNNVRDFYAKSLSQLFSFHYRNFGDHYQRIAPDIMTETAMHEFAQELERIGLIASMQERREVAEAVILQSPVLNASGVDPRTNLYTWELSVPFNLRLESGLGEGTVRRMGGVARVQVVRVEPTVHPRQILINRITIRDTTDNE